MAPGLQRRDVLDAASRILAEEGFSALSMRRIAREVGASTMVLYTLFQDKNGLLDALLAEGFARFASALRKVREADPFTHLRQLGRAYRSFALANPTYYPLLWAHRPDSWNTGRETEAAKEARGHGHAAFGALMEAVTRIIASLDGPAKEVQPAALHIWSTVHGFVSLELAGEFPPGELTNECYERSLDYIAGALRAAAQGTAPASD